MGCCNSREQGQAPDLGRSEQSNSPVELRHMGAGPRRGSRSLPQRTKEPLAVHIRIEVLAAIHAAFGDMGYGVIGGAAMAEFGSTRKTSDIDVVVPQDISDVVEGHLLSHGMVRTVGGGLGYDALSLMCNNKLTILHRYVASDDRCYGLDWSSDRDISQPFQVSQDSERRGQSRARIVKIGYLLNSKAYSYMTRIGNDQRDKKAVDAEDILFLLTAMLEQPIPTSSFNCRWVTDYDFWTTFCSTYQGAEDDLQALGLRRDKTPSASNRESLNSNMTNVSRRSIGNRSGDSNRR